MTDSHRIAEIGAMHIALQPIWTHDEVERRLREAMTTLRRLPMPIDGMPGGDRAAWPEYNHDAADRAGWIVGAASPEYLRQAEADRNRTRLHATGDQIREMDECLMIWLPMIKDRRKRKIVFARTHVWPESERSMVSYIKLGREMGLHPVTLKRWYRTGIKIIAMELTNGEK